MQFLLKILYRLGDYIRGFSLYITIIVCGGKCTSIPRVGKNFTLKYPPHSGISVGAGCDFGPGIFIDCPPGSFLSIGSNVKFTAGVIISCANTVSIGNNSLIAEYCCIRDSQHKYKKDVPIRMQGLSIGSITIGEDVWIGRSSSILMNTHIADGCVIGAASVLKGFVSMPNTVNSGNPVEFVKHRV